MERFAVNMLQVHNRGVRDGLVLTMIEESQGHEGNAPRDRDASIERLVAACGVEIEHGRHVARMAALIYAQMLGQFPVRPGDRELLESAARLQDVGYLINYEQHHKHSYHLIRHSRLDGVSASDLEIIANVARYHRGSRPRRKHANFAQLTSEDQSRVKHLAAILRVAGGLDRSNTQQVQSVKVERRGRETMLKVIAPTFPEVDIWGARRRVELFEEVFDTKLDFEWQPPGDLTPSTNGSAAESRERDAEPQEG